MSNASLPASAEVVIIGGGVMGASTAYHLASAGMNDVVVLEREGLLGQGATGRCAGGVRYQFATEVNIRLSLASLPMLERFHDELGVDPLYRPCGYLFVLTRPSDVDAFRRNVALQRSLGVPRNGSSRRGPGAPSHDALRRRPGGTLHGRDGLADPNSVVQGYAGGASARGVRFLTGCRATGIRLAGDRVRAVETNLGVIDCRQVVNAAGPWLGPVGAMAGVEIPVEPVRRQMVTTTALPSLPVDFPFVVDFARSLYLHREGDGILTGMSNPDAGPGLRSVRRSGLGGRGPRSRRPAHAGARTGRPRRRVGRAIRGHPRRPPDLRPYRSRRVLGGRRILRARVHARSGGGKDHGRVPDLGRSMTVDVRRSTWLASTKAGWCGNTT